MRVAPSEHAALLATDYAAIKLALVAVLFRASVAGGPDWRGVDLSDEHLNRMRTMLLRSDPAEPWRYAPAVMVHGYEHVFTPTHLVDDDGVDVYRVYFGGCSWLVPVGDREAPSVGPNALRANGTLPLLKWDAAFDPELAKRLPDAPPASAFVLDAATIQKKRR